MKLTYKAKVKEPFILELSTDEIGLIRYHLFQSVEATESKARWCKAMANGSSESKRLWKIQLQVAKKLSKVISDMEMSIMTLKYE